MSIFVSSRAPESAALPLSRRRVPKLVHLQILRALAASLVVVDHTVGTLKAHQVSLAHNEFAATATGMVGVAAFFVLSGLIMVRTTAHRFSSPGFAATFFYHRLARIMPIYWIATLMWLACIIHWKRPEQHLGTQLFLSLSFLPNYFAERAHRSPILGQGWTLNAEMAFYMLFAAALCLPRRLGLALLAVVPVVAAAVGIALRSPAETAAGAVLRFYCSPIVCLFALGVLLGALEIDVKLPRIHFPVSPAFLILLPPLVAQGLQAQKFTGKGWLAIGGVAVLVVALCTLADNDHPSRFDRLLVLLGDASYSTYLFHLWACLWVVAPLTALYAHWHQPVRSPVAFVAAAILLANLLGVLVHILVEQPIMSALRSPRFGSHRSGIQVPAHPGVSNR